MYFVATKHLTLRKCSDGYYRTSWHDDAGEPHQRSFGRERDRAFNQFHEFQAQWNLHWHVRNPDAQPPLTIQQAWERFKIYADAHYRDKQGEPTGEADNHRYSMQPVLDLFGGLLVTEFGPKALKAARQRMIDAGQCINYINASVRRIRHVFRWLASEELVPGSNWHALQGVEALQPGRTEARISEAVVPVPAGDLWPVIATVSKTIATMIQLQLWSGMRPGEVVIMRPVDVDVSGSVWIYRPASHKKSWRRQSRSVALGPKCQMVLQPYLSREISAFCFSPLETVRERYAECETHRRKPVAEPATGRRIGGCYSSASYARAIERACGVLGIDPAWSPNQLRHNCLTRLRQEFGLDVAQAQGGHAKADITQLYAELDLKKAIAAMEKVG